MDIYWIIDYVYKPLRLIWVDDVFFPPDWVRPSEENAVIYKNGIEQALQIQDNYPSEVSNLPRQQQWMLAIRQICQELGVGFAVTSFSYCEQNIQELKTETTLFLCDVQNLGTDNQDLMQVYGYHFVLNNLSDSWKRVKFHTRFWSPAETIRRFPELEDFGDFRQKNITPDPQEPATYREWIGSFLIHPDSYVCDAIRFYSKPWVEKWGYTWTHDNLMRKDRRCLPEAARWLELPIEVLARNNSESLKGLLMWGNDNDPWGDWDVEESEPHQNSRKIQIKVLEATCKKLDLPFQSFFISDERWIRVPCFPLLPFLVSLRSLFSHMTREGRPPETIELTGTPLEPRGFEFYLLSIRLSQDPKQNDPWGLAEAFRQRDFDEKHKDGEHTTTLNLRVLPWCRTLNLSKNLGTDHSYMKLFRHGSKIPVVAVYFAPYFIHLVWTGVLIDQ